MTRLLRRRPAGRHRLAGSPRADRTRRTGRYAAAGLLALAGAVATPALRSDGAETAATLRPLTTRTAPRVAAPRAAAPRRATRGTVRAHRPLTRWATRTVAGPTLRGRATWYGPGFEGRRTASGEVFRSRAALTAAHRTLPFGTRLRVCYQRRCAVVRINDRGPYGDAILDLSWKAAHAIGLDAVGIGPVTATVLTTRRERVLVPVVGSAA
jgi:rare lipoprotein A